ncbi:MAG: YjbQ family protein [Thermoplasmata archaeon]|nr:YjbQ family protein [Thermoplasmata archaeon]
MKVMTDFIEVESGGRGHYEDITDEVARIVEKSGIDDGVIILHEMHTTAALVIQEADEDVHRDTMDVMDEIVPSNRKYRHIYEGVSNATAHIKNQIMGSNLSIPVMDGKMTLGTWQRIFLVELFEKRRRRVAVVVMGTHSST